MGSTTGSGISGREDVSNLIRIRSTMATAVEAVGASWRNDDTSPSSISQGTRSPHRVNLNVVIPKKRGFSLHGMTPLHWALQKGHVHVCHLLLQQGMSPLDRDN